MSALLVPQLSRKLQMLVECGHYPSIKAVAAALGRSPITLRGWVHGGSGTAPERIPHAMISSVLALYARALPDLSADDVQRMLIGPAETLEDLMRAAAVPSFNDLVEREADLTSGRLIFPPRSTLSLVRRRSAKTTLEGHTVAPGQDFRIEFAAPSRPGFVAAFQAGPAGWGVVPCTLAADPSRILLPGVDETGAPDWMVEDNDIGLHRFIAVQTGRPFPPEIAAAEKDGTQIDRALLAHVRRHYEAQDARTRRLFVLDLEVRRSESTQL